MKFIETVQQYEKDMIDTIEADKLEEEMYDINPFAYWELEMLERSDISLDRYSEWDFRSLSFEYYTAYRKKRRAVVILMKILSNLPKDLQSIVLSYDKHLFNYSNTLEKIESNSFTTLGAPQWNGHIRITKLKNNYTKKNKYKIEILKPTKDYTLLNNTSIGNYWRLPYFHKCVITRRRNLYNSYYHINWYYYDYMYPYKVYRTYYINN